MNIAIIGTGISGLVSAHFLSERHHVTAYEAGDRAGGHTHTVDVVEDGKHLAIDTGFIVYNERTYPNFIRLLERLGVASRPTEMGFSVRCEASGLEYSGSSLRGLYAQPANLFSPAHNRMILDILRFFREGKAFLTAGGEDLTLGALLESRGYGARFKEKYLVPMLSAIWSAAPEAVLDFPSRHFLRFFENHGLLDVRNRPVWRVVEGGSRSYVEAIAARLSQRIRLRTPVKRVLRTPEGVRVETPDSAGALYDHVIFATHSDQALRILGDATDTEREVLGAIPYQENDVVLHTDVSLLPRRRAAWASWNYCIPREVPDRAVLTYNMNILQGLQSRQTYCVTLNQTEAIDPARLIGRYTYEHPVFSARALAAQQRWREISNQRGTHFCGAYWGYGFHEDGVNSALSVCADLGAGW